MVFQNTFTGSEFLMQGSAQCVMFPCSTFSILTTRKISGCGFVTEKIPWGRMTSVRYFYATYIWLFGNCQLVVWRVQNVDIQHRSTARILGIGTTVLSFGELFETGSSHVIAQARFELETTLFPLPLECWSTSIPGLRHHVQRVTLAASNVSSQTQFLVPYQLHLGSVPDIQVSLCCQTPSVWLFGKMCSQT